MDARAEKLANARRKLRDHQEKKTQKDCVDICAEKNDHLNNIGGNENTNMDEVISISHDEDSADSRNEGLNSYQTKTPNVTEDKIQDVKMAEYLIYNQKCLENEVQSLQNKLSELNSLYTNEQINHNKFKEKSNILESEVSILSDKYAKISQDLKNKDDLISELKSKTQILLDENNNLNEQLDFTKTMLKTKESDNAQLHNQVCLYYSQLEAARLQVQQLTIDSTTENVHKNSNSAEIEQLQTKISGLEQKIAIMEQEREHITSYYEHYMKDLTTQLNSTTLRNEDLSKEVSRLSDRESGLVDQISDMEIRLQNFNKKDFEVETQVDTSELQKQLISLQITLEQSEKQKGELQKQLEDAVAKINELEQLQKPECEHDALSVTKLSADITSDKIAAQRATEQNVKLKSDIEGLELVIVKMTKDKLELTEMLTHEKKLNKELMIKLADIEELGKTVNNKLRAKDEEMMRLQNESREIAKKYNEILEHGSNHSSCKINNESEHNEHISHDVIEEHTIDPESNNNILETETNANEKKIASFENDFKTNCIIPKEDAMLKLQQRFMNIMDEVANLSDEKHRLEHIILQLQNETDTICEYVALYQQQRSLLKKRDEERTHQLKMFEKECNELKHLLGELRDLLFRLAEDKEISKYLKTDARNDDMARLWELLKKLQNSSLLNKNFKTMDINSFYPCSCCSGKLIDV
ncbi:golgin subfamily A member 2 [Zerene cesonia]|uniref:golgin subfamily A member 2 n=1 Tax=Zerene cesonia TaxID=33412 RepID=UPI0018E55044|nr:golgin subfamily A member 2 [Zerene cesonia]